MSEVVMCSKCKTWVSPGEKTCPKCGTPVVTTEMLNQVAEQKDAAERDKERLPGTIISLILFLVIAIAWTVSASSPEYEEGFFTALGQGIIMGWAFGTFPCGWAPAMVATLFSGYVMFPVNLVRYGIQIYKKKKGN